MNQQLETLDLPKEIAYNYAKDTAELLKNCAVKSDYPDTWTRNVKSMYFKTRSEVSNCLENTHFSKNRYFLNTLQSNNHKNNFKTRSKLNELKVKYDDFIKILDSNIVRIKNESAKLN